MSVEYRFLLSCGGVAVRQGQIQHPYRLIGALMPCDDCRSLCRSPT
jgi:hypothetical protein